MSTEFPLRNDLDIARTVENVLWWTGYWRRNEITVSVERGWVTLSGTVDWDYQKRMAAHALKDLAGIAGFVDHIAIKFGAEPPDPVAPDEPGRTLDAVSLSRWS